MRVVREGAKLVIGWLKPESNCQIRQVSQTACLAGGDISQESLSKKCFSTNFYYFCLLKGLRPILQGITSPLFVDFYLITTSLEKVYCCYPIL